MRAAPHLLHADARAVDDRADRLDRRLRVAAVGEVPATPRRAVAAASRGLRSRRVTRARARGTRAILGYGAHSSHGVDESTSRGALPQLEKKELGSLYEIQKIAMPCTFSVLSASSASWHAPVSHPR